MNLPKKARGCLTSIVACRGTASKSLVSHRDSILWPSVVFDTNRRAIQNARAPMCRQLWHGRRSDHHFSPLSNTSMRYKEVR